MAWNINRGTSRYLPQLRDEQVDVAVLSEASARLAADQPPVESWDSVGAYADRSLVLAGLSQPVQALPARSNQGQWALAGVTEPGIGVLGIWTTRPEASSYGTEAVASLDAYDDFLRERPCLIAGDFNLAPGLMEDAETGVLRDIFDRLGVMDAPFHIDLVFVHQDLAVRNVEVGTYAGWVARTGDQSGDSDHVPLIVDIG